MLEQIKKAGTKEFLLALLMLALIGFISSYIRFILPVYKMIGDMIGIGLFCVMAFFVLTRYTAVFTYRVGEDSLRLNRTIGKRNKEVEIPFSMIKRITPDRPKVKYLYNYCRFILPSPKVRYIIFELDRLQQAVRIEADKELETALKRIKAVRS